MNFFEQQAATRRRSRRLVAAFALAIATVIVAVTWVLASLAAVLRGEAPYATAAWLAAHPGPTLLTALVVGGVIGAATLVRMSQLAGGGGAVARALGGERVQRGDADPLKRRLLNVVEEMAIASGTPVPEVYVLEREAGINAFAAGLSTADAAVAVTRGALERLNRAELSGVVGHEFSHILNGDMRLNTRLAGPLFGLLMIATAARQILRHFRGRSGRNGGVAMIAVLAVMALGYLGVFLGRLLQAGISRQREFLADASSAQFTRDPGALRDALVRIARSGRTTRFAAADGEDLAHLFFLPAYARLFATHPPLAERVRALDPRYPLAELGKLEAADAGPLELGAEDGLTSESAAFAPAAAAPLSPQQVVEAVGHPGLDQLAYARALREALPAEAEAALARGAEAAALWLALLAARDPAARPAQRAAIAAELGEPMARQVERLLPVAQALPVVQRLPTVQRALPVLARLPAERRRTLAALTHRLAALDGRIEVFEFMLGHLAAQYLAEQLEPPAGRGRLALDACAEELGQLFAAVAAAGHEGPAEARRAYERGLARLLPRERPAYAAPTAAWHGTLNLALQRLDQLRPHAKELLVAALAETVVHDGRVHPGEAELLRAACAALHCPLPPLLAAA